MSLKSIVRTISMLITIVLLHPAIDDSALYAAPQFNCCPEIVRVQTGVSKSFGLEVSDTATSANYRWSLTLLSPTAPTFSVAVDSISGLVSITNPNLGGPSDFNYRLVVSDSSGSADSCDFPLQVVSYIIGDMNDSGHLNVSDATWIIGWLWAGYPAPRPLMSGDANCSGEVTISDAVYMINFIFHHGPAPCTPCPW